MARVAVHRWYLYLCLLLGFAFFAIGSSNLLYCSIFWFVPLELTNGALLYALSVTGLCQSGRIGLRPILVLIGFLMLHSVGLGSLNLLSLICIYSSSHRHDYSTSFNASEYGNDIDQSTLTTERRDFIADQLCTATYWRTAASTQRCFAFSADFLNAVNAFPQFLPRPSALAVLATTAVALACLQILLLLGLGRSAVHQSRVKSGAGDVAQIVIGILLLCSGAAHFSYCGLYFYAGIGLWAPAILILSGVFGLCIRHSPDEPLRGELLKYGRRSKPPSYSVWLTIVCICACCALIGSTGAGSMCWLAQNNESHPLLGLWPSGVFKSDHCQAAPYLSAAHRAIYQRCEISTRSAPGYSGWPKNVVETEIAAVKGVSYFATLVLAGLELIRLVFTLVGLIERRRSYK